MTLKAKRDRADYLRMEAAIRSGVFADLLLQRAKQLEAEASEDGEVGGNRSSLHSLFRPFAPDIQLTGLDSRRWQVLLWPPFADDTRQAIETVFRTQHMFVS